MDGIDLAGLNLQYDAMYKQSVEDPDGFWSEIGSQFYWKTKWEVKDGKIHEENFDVRNGPIAVEVDHTRLRSLAKTVAAKSSG